MKSDHVFITPQIHVLIGYLKRKEKKIDHEGCFQGAAVVAEHRK
jgi:hypothetical protein